MSTCPSMVIIGGGRVGQTLGRLWVSNQLANVLVVCNTSLDSAQKACDFIGAGEALCDISDCPSADIMLVTTPDDQLESVISALYESHRGANLKTILLHCSGCYASTDFKLPDNAGFQLASVHPVMSVASPEIAIKHFRGVMCGYEGSSEALSVLLPLFKAIGASLFEVRSAKKATYHAGLVIASNYVVGLLEASQSCLRRAGLSDEQASSLAQQLMRQSFANIEAEESLSSALTGPIQRGDSATIQRHRDALDADLDGLYQVLGLQTLLLTQHSEKVLSQLRSALLVQDNESVD